MKAYVGVADLDWYRLLLATGAQHDEVNFWFPSPRQGFKTLAPGHSFIFKTHVDRSQPAFSNRIVGVGLFSGFARMRISEVWHLLGRRMAWCLSSGFGSGLSTIFAVRRPGSRSGDRLRPPQQHGLFR